MATVKTAYTPEQTLELVSAYKANPSMDIVDQFAAKFSKTTKSVIAKLSREGVYQKKEYVSKSGEKPVKKDSVADEIGMLVQLSESEIDSLTKANKTALNKILLVLKEKLLDKNQVI
jgi:uncharacterized protein YutE (UPF0331/DUF86 family)